MTTISVIGLPPGFVTSYNLVTKRIETSPRHTKSEIRQLKRAGVRSFVTLEKSVKRLRKKAGQIVTEGRE